MIPIRRGKLGRKHPSPHAKRVRLAEYLCRPLPTAPPSWDGTPGTILPMFCNDRLSCCTISAVGHILMVQSVREGRTPLMFTDDDIQNFYFAMSGGQDEGLVEVDVLNAIRDQGFPLTRQHKLFAWASINEKDLDEVRAACAVFEGVYLGADLDQAVESQEIWDVAPAGQPNVGQYAPGSLGGHAMVVVGYDATGFLLSTWGRVLRCTNAWFQTYVDETYVVVSAERQQSDHAKDLVNWSDLLADLQIAAGTCLPLQPTPPLAVPSTPAAPPWALQSQTPDVKPGTVFCPSCGHTLHDWLSEREADPITHQPSSDSEPHIERLSPTVSRCPVCGLTAHPTRFIYRPEP